MSIGQHVFSDDRRHRYALWRSWPTGFAPIDPVRANQYVLWICLNPSTADETTNDATMRRCISFSKEWGFGAMCMANLFAYRALHPDEMRQYVDPVGKQNDYWLRTLAAGAGLVVAGWGNDGTFKNRDEKVSALLAEQGIEMQALGFTMSGHPLHPLYVPKEAKLYSLAR